MTFAVLGKWPCLAGNQHKTFNYAEKGVKFSLKQSEKVKSHSILCLIIFFIAPSTKTQITSLDSWTHQPSHQMRTSFFPFVTSDIILFESRQILYFSRWLKWQIICSKIFYELRFVVERFVKNWTNFHFDYKFTGTGLFDWNFVRVESKMITLTGRENGKCVLVAIQLY